MDWLSQWELQRRRALHSGTAAIQVIKQRGVTAATTKEIARAADAARPSSDKMKCGSRVSYGSAACQFSIEGFYSPVGSPLRLAL